MSVSFSLPLFPASAAHPHMLRLRLLSNEHRTNQEVNQDSLWSGNKIRGKLRPKANLTLYEYVSQSPLKHDEREKRNIFLQIFVPQLMAWTAYSNGITNKESRN
jgi:hypothetical protein